QVASFGPDVRVQIQELPQALDGEAFTLVRPVDQHPEQLLIVGGCLFGLSLLATAAAFGRGLGLGPLGPGLWAGALLRLGLGRRLCCLGVLASGVRGASYFDGGEWGPRRG